MSQNISPLVDFQITFEDGDGVEYTKIFSLEEGVIDYIRFLENECSELEDAHAFYKLFYQQHFTQMVELN